MIATTDTRTLLAAVLATTLSAGLAGCLEDPIARGEAPSLELTDRDRAITPTTVVTLLGAQSHAITVRNAGEAVLEVRGIAVESTPAGALVVDATPLPSAEAPVLVHPEGGPESPTSWSFSVSLAPGVDPADVTGTVTVTTNPTLAEKTAFSFPIEVLEATPRLSVQPATLDFEQVPPGETATRQLTLLNTGDAPLVVTHFVLSGHPGFALTIGDATFPVSPETASAGITLDPPVAIAAGSTESLVVSFASTGAEAAEATLVFTSDGAPSGLVVPLSANAHGPCIAINPSRVDFGGKVVGSQSTSTVDILSCGDAPLVVSALSVVDDAGGVFSADTAALGATPLTVAPGQSLTVPVTYAPSAAALFDDLGTPIADYAALRIESNALLPRLEVQLRGFGTVTDCPTAAIIVPEGEEVIPQTKLHLVGSQSFGTMPIASYQWTVEQPVGSASVFLPSAAAPDPTFEANVVGTYVFHLTVTDIEGTEGCQQATYVVTVSSGEALHIELLWTTPNDPDETDEGPVAGSDLDLHFAHPFAAGADGDRDGEPDPWFDAQFDAFWYNPRPNWGSLDPLVDDDPRLDRDDTDGAGPENLNLSVPENVTYEIGVHSWNDHGFGVSYATVRVYEYGNLVFEWADVEILPCAMWKVGTVAWPSGVVTPLLDASGQSPAMVPNYVNPYFPNDCGT
ncbi:MAG: choice-of-anchor D domain-containing protein [Deltaproteobacteria bacterium]|nr:MAG: choice-of-anchor D domain-containing protein [Deltaproteobacteria bacterium]